MNFNELSLSNEVQEAIADMGFVDASPIQSQTIPLILEGKDVIGQAQTGTGKTAAFGIPMVEMLQSKTKSVKAVVLCPTRELAVQVSQELKKIAKYRKGLHILPIYGGESIEKQIGALKRGVQIIVGTPGRVIDHLERKTLSFDEVDMVVLDEADEMLNMGFREDIESILKRMPEEKQTVFFSATMPKPILELVHKFQKNPKLVKVTNNELTAASIEQNYFEVTESSKINLISRLIDLNGLQLMLVFCNTKKKVDDVVKDLRQKGHKAEGIHGDLRQNQRNNVLSMFRRSEVNILVATDVAARGIDVSNVDGVFNYDIPLDPEYYVHRIGRTGRAGKTGVAFSFVTGRNERRLLMDIESYTKVKISKKNIPSLKEMMDVQRQRLLEKLNELAAEGDLENYDEILEFLRKEGFTLHDLTKVLLKLHVQQQTQLEEIEVPKDHDRNRDRGERGDRGVREDRRSSSGKGKNGNSNMVRLFINAGRKDRISPKDIAGSLVGNSGIKFEGIGNIDIYDSYTFVDVEKLAAEKVVAKMKNQKIKGRKINVEIAR